MSEYAAAKARIFAGDGTQVLNRNDRYSAGMRRPGRQAVTIGYDPAPDHDEFGLLKVFGEHWLAKGATPLVAAADLRLAGLHNAVNALAALALCRAIGLQVAPLLDALRRFEGLPHRLERVADIDRIAFYDDSKGTNVGSTVAALDGFAREFGASGRKVVLIAGGDGKGQDFGPLADAVAGAARAVVLIGRDAPLIAAALASTPVPLEHAATMQEAVAKALNAARAADVVLLLARLRELRHVRQLQGALRGVLRRGAGAGGGACALTVARRPPSTTRASCGRRCSCSRSGS
jgi:UDP-N-acetylmuramoylalanine--D-glutamate ligase